MKTQRRDLLNPIRQPQGLAATVNNLATRTQRIERAPVKIILQPPPPKKAPKAEPTRIEQPGPPLAELLVYGYFSGEWEVPAGSANRLLIVTAEVTSSPSEGEYSPVFSGGGLTWNAIDSIYESVDLGAGASTDMSVSWWWAADPEGAGFTLTASADSPYSINFSVVGINGADLESPIVQAVTDSDQDFPGAAVGTNLTLASFANSANITVFASNKQHQLDEPSPSSLTIATGFELSVDWDNQDVLWAAPSEVNDITYSAQAYAAGFIGIEIARA